jgi:ParB/RepB/Spo0J family partition protein
MNQAKTPATNQQLPSTNIQPPDTTKNRKKEHNKVNTQHISETLLAQGTAAQINNESILISPSEIKMDPSWNTRHYANEPVTDLVESIAKDGQVEPIVVTPDDNGILWVVAGFRRFRAGIALEQKDPNFKIKAEVRSLTPAERISINLAENVRRKNLSPVDQGHAVNKLVEGGMKKSEVAKMLGVSPAQISLLTAITTLPAKIQKKLHDGDISIQAAYEISQSATPEEQEALYTKLVAASGGGKIGRADVARAKDVSTGNEDGEDQNPDDLETPAPGGAARPGKKSVTAKQLAAWVGRLKEAQADETAKGKKPSKAVVDLLDTFSRFMDGKTSEAGLLNKLAKLLPAAE